MDRIRATEVLCAVVWLDDKRYAGAGRSKLSQALRRKIRETMLYAIKTYAASSVLLQQALSIHKHLKKSYDSEDWFSILLFVRSEVESANRYKYKSGRTA